MLLNHLNLANSRLSEAGADVRLGTRDVNNVNHQVGLGVKLVSNKVVMMLLLLSIQNMNIKN